MTTLAPKPKPLGGPLRFIRYAFMPNHLSYCGPGDNQALFEYGTQQVVDGGLPPLLGAFAGAVPYLRLIARANNIQDPFDARVVDAYWLGNSLLEAVEVRELHDALLARVGKQLQGSARRWVLGKAPAGARPHHNFHVFDVHSRVGEQGRNLHTMDQCRISWGKVLSCEGSELIVERRPLVIDQGRLALGPARQERVTRQFEGRGFADDAAPGDWVSLHWGWVCEVIGAAQQAQLAHYTDFHLTLASATL